MSDVFNPEHILVTKRNSHEFCIQFLKFIEIQEEKERLNATVGQGTDCTNESVENNGLGHQVNQPSLQATVGQGIDCIIIPHASSIPLSIRFA